MLCHKALAKNEGSVIFWSEWLRCCKNHWKKKLVQKASPDHTTTLHYFISYYLLGAVVRMFQGTFRVAIVGKADNGWLPD